MKKIIYTLFVFAAVVVLFNGCKITCPNQEIQYPCSEEAQDDSLYFRQLGIGSSRNMQFARDMAIMDAQRQLCRRLDSLYNVVLHNIKSDTIFTNNIKWHYESFQKNCERASYSTDNLYYSFITLQIEKESIIKQIYISIDTATISKQKIRQIVQEGLYQQ